MTPEEPHDPFLPSPSTTYPWGRCLGRFVLRTLAGLAISFVLLVLFFLSAIPYGGGDKRIFGLWAVVTVLLLVWACAAFVPPAGSWQRTISAWRVTAYAVLALLPVALTAASLVKPVAVEKKERAAWADKRELGIRQCSADLPTLSAPPPISSLLIESGRVEQRMLRDLLGGRGLRFVELRAKAGEDWRTHEKTYGVNAFSGDETTHFGVAPDVRIVRLSLSQPGDPACTTQAVVGLPLDMGGVPIAPGTCLRVERDTESQASHALKAVPAGANAELIKWALVERATGTVLAGLTSSDSPLSPSRQRGGAERELRRFGDDTVSCRSPHDSLMNLVYGPPRGEHERLSLGKRTVALDLAAAETDGVASWEQLQVAESAVGDWSERPSARHGPAWDDAFAAAGQSGWAGYESGVIDFKAGVIIEPRVLARPGLRTVVRGTDAGFMVAWRGAADSVALAHFGLDGRLRWKRQVVSAHPGGDRLAQFDLVGMEWDPRALRLYGFRRYLQPPANGDLVEVRVLAIPLSARTGAPADSSR